MIAQTGTLRLKSHSRILRSISSLIEITLFLQMCPVFFFGSIWSVYLLVKTLQLFILTHRDTLLRGQNTDQCSLLTSSNVLYFARGRSPLYSKTVTLYPVCNQITHREVFPAKLPELFELPVTMYFFVWFVWVKAGKKSFCIVGL